MSGDIFGCQDGVGVGGGWDLTSNELKPGMLLNILICTEQSPFPSTTNNYSSQRAAVEKLWGRCVISLVSGNPLARTVPGAQKTLKTYTNE